MSILVIWMIVAHTRRHERVLACEGLVVHRIAMLVRIHLSVSRVVMGSLRMVTWEHRWVVWIVRVGVLRRVLLLSRLMWSYTVMWMALMGEMAWVVPRVVMPRMNVARMMWMSSMRMIEVLWVHCRMPHMVFERWMLASRGPVEMWRHGQGCRKVWGRNGMVRIWVKVLIRGRRWLRRHERLLPCSEKARW